VISVDGTARHRGGERNIPAVKTKSRCNVSGCEEETSRGDTDATGS